MTSKITIQALIEADKKKVWDYYTQPQHIIHWNYASDDWCCPYAANDMTIGGKYMAKMEAKDGSFGFELTAIYQEINEGDSFIFRLLDDREVKVNFIDLGDNTEVVIHFDPEKVNPIEMQRDGWQAILNNFKKYTESH